MNTPLERQLFNSATAYYQAATILMKPPDSLGAHSALLAQPAVTCASMSLKLYMKSLLTIEGKDREDAIYRIADLFRNFSDGLKALILRKFDEYSNTQLTADDLMKHLDILDNAFSKWRYIHDEDAGSVNLEDLEEMILATKASIAALKPDWE